MARAAKDVHQVVPHQQRLVFVDRQRRAALARAEDEIDASMLDAAAGQQCVHARKQTYRRIGQVDRFESADPNGNHRGGACHDAFLVIRQDRRLPLAARAVARSVEVDKEHRAVGRRMRDATPDTGPDVAEVRIGVARFDVLLRLGQLSAKIHPVVAIPGARWEDGPELAHESRNTVAALSEPPRQILFEVAGGRVRRPGTARVGTAAGRRRLRERPGR